MNDSTYSFTNNWFASVARPVWDWLIPQINPRSILEIGSYEGASTCFLIEKLANDKAIELHCVDTWGGGIEHREAGDDMLAVERRFRNNIQLAKSRVANEVRLEVYKGRSDNVLSKMLGDGRHGDFDFIYIDGSHQAPDVLFDAVLSFRLLRKNGVIAFDDYLWQERLPYGVDPIRCPKIAIDAFTNIYCRDIRILKAPLYQLYIQKTSD